MTENKKFKRLVRARAARTGESYSTSLQHLRARKTEEPQMTDTQTPESEAEVVTCSFCGKSQKDVKKLIAGPAQIYICDECVGLCAEIITDDVQELKPSEEQLAAAWSAMLKNRANLARIAEADLDKLVRQARAKGLEWSTIANFVGVTPEEAASRWGDSAP